jgi:TPR repeat protein
MKCQDFNRAYELYHKAAIPQNNLGCMLARGYGCEKDDKKAMKYFKRSSEGGSAAAKYNVGVLHQNGWGVKADFEKAKDWFDAAAANPSTTNILT